MRLLITGVAGFVGHACAGAALDAGAEVTGVDDLGELYYPRALKEMRLRTLEGRDGFAFERLDIADAEALASLVARMRPTHVLHLAAHAAVLPSFERPFEYMSANVMGTQAVFEAARRADPAPGIVYASTSSVYGRSDGTPFREDMPTDRPISVYGASKVACEAMAQIYADRYGLAVTGLRLFKVYGPWARPDTVFYAFTDRIWRGAPIELRNHGRISHSFTYIGDVVDGVLSALARLRPLEAGSRHPVYNLGNPSSERLDRCVDLIEAALGRTADRRYVDLPAGDRSYSCADVSLAADALGYRPRTSVDEGLPAFARWYRETIAGEASPKRGAAHPAG